MMNHLGYQVITLLWQLMHSCTTTTIAIIMIMVIIIVPPSIWMAQSGGGISVMISCITRPGVPTISCFVIIARHIRVSHSSDIVIHFE